LVVQEKTAPYLVTVAQISSDAIAVGRSRNRRAIEIYKECQATGIWSAYQTKDMTTDNHAVLIDLPDWAYRNEGL